MLHRRDILGEGLTYTDQTQHQIHRPEAMTDLLQKPASRQKDSPSQQISKSRPYLYFRQIHNRNIMNGHITNEQAAGRILAKTKLTSLAAGYSIDGKPFSILVVPKEDVTNGVISNVAEEIGLIVSCKCYADAEASDMPVYFHRYTEGAIVELAANAIDLTTYDVYVGAGMAIS